MRKTLVRGIATLVCAGVTAISFGAVPAVAQTLPTRSLSTTQHGSDAPVTAGGGTDDGVGVGLVGVVGLDLSAAVAVGVDVDAVLAAVFGVCGCAHRTCDSGPAGSDGGPHAARH